MKSVFKPLLLGGLLATMGFAALAQAPAPLRGHMMGQDAVMQHAGMGFEGRQHMTPVKMQEHMAGRQAELKAQLKLTPTQESAWTTYTSAMKPPAGMLGQRPDRAELDKLSTPERIDKMKTLRAQRMADMTAALDKRDDATKAFYATLTPEQKKTFDASTTRRHGHAGRRGGPAIDQGMAQPKS
jgi:protein CpxP